MWKYFFSGGAGVIPVTSSLSTVFEDSVQTVLGSFTEISMSTMGKLVGGTL